ncbi:MAG: hypothetical protein CO030_03385 [Candidatus Magasanikbacteria bacterium CG_4_9_14_0_2_um_filter_42_11]|uniref:ATP-grasp domain-containing protein n=1 Tax=Candidatus Magasanikbacteria bacterium CG_4_9_14_0_2_um_filter_42_11 TaxID=1974643 RepID=A0A2M8F9E8_9BACT|nr:MAG: hypothetical protein COU34_05515 [Candidatus Magasanikbacteria bacterium CG10_big_fil_rev_8_21_14_0_10_43_9]PIY93019.1 MAG: hypothetical protein COY70_00230 [Candidatus Magasanikbacteria bacterium CG_4_10_14_0_8_um_filter_42_12]PJC52347.1 MAG: hypothetical protein CO030_03385 [Candidatus Magasanikbacteria bacterium CG_4_9_14_0_2_um_filter_42_11]
MKSTLTQSVTYIARDIERALGVPKNTVNYAIISNNSTFAKDTVHSYDVTLVESDETLSTQELLAASDIEKRTNILVFKNTKAIERIATEKEVHLLNPSAELAGKIEEKISQIAWLGELTKFLPAHDIKTCKELTFDTRPYIVQFNHAHSGEGTMLITSEEDLAEVKEKFPDRPVRMTQFIDGPVYTINAVVHAGGVLVSSPSYQITGLSPFTDNQFTTIGNDWGAAHTMLSDAQKETIQTMATEIGEKMKNDGWKGLFGIDVVVEEKTGMVYLIEINARQPASTTFESWLQTGMVVDRQPYPNPPLSKGREHSLSTFEVHLRALLGEDLSEFSLIPVEHGAQILQRVTGKITVVSEKKVSEIRALDCTVIEYDERKIGVELLRIQSKESFIQEHNVLSQKGSEIAKIL